MPNTFLSAFNLDSWAITNTDNGEIVEGQFHAEDLTENISANYSTHTALGMQNPYVQFVNGAPRTIAFKARLFSNGFPPGEGGIPIQHQAEMLNLKGKLDKLRTWAKVDPEEGRPPLLSFTVGSGAEVSMSMCVITSLGGISYERPRSTGSMRDVSLSISLLEYHEYDLDKVTKLLETRYYNVAEGDYYEMLTFREYGDPNSGDIIRKRHPKQATLEVGDTVKLPSFEAIDTVQVTQTSIALKTGWGRKDTPQKELRKSKIEARNRTYVSHILLED